MVSEMEQCDHCRGRGFNTGYSCPGFKPFSVACEPCNQTGFVAAGSQDADRVRKAIAEGKRLNRIERGVSLRDEAKALGVSPLELSDMEHGRKELAGMTIVHCCLGMQFATREHLFVVRQELPLFDSGAMTVPRLMVIVAFCPWCGKEIQLVADNDRRGER